MKIVVVSAVIVLFGCSVTAQEGFRIDLNAGIPLGNNGDFAAFVANIDFEYGLAVSDAITVGAGAGATVYSGKEAFNDFKYVPLVASADIKLVDALSVGVDLGYGISLESNIDGALVYRFQTRYNFTNHFDATVRFNAYASKPLGTLSDISVGLGYRF